MADMSRHTKRAQLLLSCPDKAALVEWLENHIEGASHVLVVCASPGNDVPLHIDGQQLGFRYRFELNGFIDSMYDLFTEEESPEDG